MGLFLHDTNSNSTIENLHLQGTGYTGPMVVSSGQEPLHSVRFRRVFLENKIAEGQVAKWGYRLYNLRDSLFKNCKVFGINKEHAVYLNVEGGLTFETCHFFDCGAQGVQIAWRSIETNNPDGWKVPGTHTMKACRIEKCGQPRGYGRASYAVTFFGKQNDPITDPQTGLVSNGPRTRWDCPVVLVDTSIIHVAEGYELRGALLVEHRPKLTVIGGETYYDGAADRDLWHIFNVDEVEVDGCDFFGQRFVDIQGAKRISFKNCTGSVRLRVDGKAAGLVSDGYEWQHPSWIPAAA